MGEPAGPDGDSGDPVVSCDLQGGTLSVFEDRVSIERSKRSMFDDKTIPVDEVTGVGYSEGILNGHIQVRQTGMDHGSGGFLAHPVDENTLYFPRSDRPAARAARDAIRARVSRDAAETGTG